MQPSTLFFAALASASVAMGLPFNLFRPTFSGGSAPAGDAPAAPQLTPPN
ncbi:hypothetical protein THARTR1_01354 [Trichoderma harzianum]|uniref:Uncharacterized protein n=1 Tax=Trichoderma harzianum TaxID=5544 RepID=A0A2K0UMU4_TRIHA|nr:hypothetical protein THARTR1_01354 [Trichoderma harzianum]